jgi:hypothetical protein
MEGGGETAGATRSARCQMTTMSQAQGRYRSAVASAWRRAAAAEDVDPADKAAQDSWYRARLVERTRLSSTKGLSADTILDLAKAFDAIGAEQAPAESGGAPRIQGFSDAQQAAFQRLASKAFRAVRERDPGIQFSAWLNARIGDATPLRSGGRAGQTKFDTLMCMLAVVANDEFWMDRTAEGPERRMRHLIRGKLDELGSLTGRTLDWEYVRGIHDQAKLSACLEDCPAQYLRSILAILATAVRRARMQAAPAAPQSLPI